MNIKKLLIFEINGVLFAADMLIIKEVLRIQKIEKYHNQAGFIEGIINVRGELIPVIDLRKRMSVNVECYHYNNRIIVVNLNMDSGIIPVAFIVDSAFDTFEIDESLIKTSPEKCAGINNKFIIGIIEYSEKIATLLNFEMLFKDAEKIELTEWLKNINRGITI